MGTFTAQNRECQPCARPIPCTQPSLPCNASMGWMSQGRWMRKPKSEYANRLRAIGLHQCSHPYSENTGKGAFNVWMNFTEDRSRCYHLFLSLSLIIIFTQLDAKASLWRLRQKCFEVTEKEICADRTKVAACTHHLQVRGVVEAVVMETIEISSTWCVNFLSSLPRPSLSFSSSSPDITCAVLP